MHDLATGEWGHGWGLFGGFGMLLFWIVILFGIFFLLRWFVGGLGKAEGVSPQPGALEILEQRYARGEINHDQYLQMREDLRPGDTSRG